MGSLRTLLLLGAGAAIGGAVLMAYRISQEKGKSLPEAFADVPAEARRLFSEVSARFNEAIEQGREAYLQKQEELQGQLEDQVAAQ